MKIVDRKTFMRMPKGTVFCKFPRFNEATCSYDNYLFGISEPYVKMDDTDGESVDFCAMGIGSGLEPIGSTGSSDTDDILTDMERNPGKEVAFEYSYGRDGMYEGDEVGFAIFSRDEVMLMIRTLQESLTMAYKQEEKPIDVALDQVTNPEQSWRLITSGMPKDSADMKAVPCDPIGTGMQKGALLVIMSNPDDFDPMANRPFGYAYIAWTLQRMIEILPKRINLQLEYDLDRYIYRHGDTYVVKYESHVQIVEYRKQSLAEALVEMLRYLLRYDFTKQQLNLKTED